MLDRKSAAAGDDDFDLLTTPEERAAARDARFAALARQLADAIWASRPHGDLIRQIQLLRRQEFQG